MLNEELRLSLMREHARDKRLTYIGYSLILIVAVVVIYFLGGFLLSLFQSEEELYPKLAVLGIIVFYLFYAISKIVKLSRREKMIVQALEKLQNGARATTTFETREYKIVIWLGKITYKMCPVDYQNFVLDVDPSRTYCVPVSPAYATDFKNLLSGVDPGAINEKIADIYSDDTPVEYDTAPDVPVKTVEEFREFLKNEMGDKVEALEGKRKKTRSSKLVMGTVSAFVVFGVMAYVFYNAYNSEDGQVGYMTYLPVFAIFILFYIVYAIFMRGKASKAAVRAAAAGNPNAYTSIGYDFKSQMVERIIKFVSPDSEYVMHGHVSMPELAASGMFREANYELAGSDLVIGRHRGVPFQFCDLTVTVRKRMQKENESPDCAFSGQFFVARFNKSFSSPVYVVPRTGIKGLYSGNDASAYMITAGQKVELEDPEFMKLFNVYGGDQIEARYILTPAMMQRIKDLAARTGGKYHIAFYENRITVANNSGQGLFALGDKKSLSADDHKVLVDFYRDLCDQFALVDDLKLNIKIWN